MFKIRKTAALAALFCSSALNAWASADHMVIAMPQIPTIIEPQGINNNAIDRYVGNVFETLLKADQKTGELKPGLAESWRRLSPDTVEFKLRSGVRFHDGTPLTADDVVFTFGPERFSGEKAPGRAVAWEFLGNLKEVVKVDDLTVRVTMKAPDPMVERRFSARTSEIISEDGWKAAGGWEKWLKAPVGTGPYRIASFKTGNRLELKRLPRLGRPRRSCWPRRPRRHDHDARRASLRLRHGEAHGPPSRRGASRRSCPQDACGRGLRPHLRRLPPTN